MEGADIMKLELTIGPVTILKVVMFEPTEDLAEPEVIEVIHRNDDEEDNGRRLRGDE